MFLDCLSQLLNCSKPENQDSDQSCTNSNKNTNNVHVNHFNADQSEVNLQIQLDNAKRDLQRADQDIRYLNQNNSECKRTISDLDYKLRENQREAYETQKELQRSEQDLRKLNQTHGECTRTISDLDYKLRENQRHFYESQHALERAEQDLRNLNQMHNKCMTTISALQEELWRMKKYNERDAQLRQEKICKYQTYVADLEWKLQRSENKRSDTKQYLKEVEYDLCYETDRRRRRDKQVSRLKYEIGKEQKPSTLVAVHQVNTLINYPNQLQAYYAQGLAYQ